MTPHSPPSSAHGAGLPTTVTTFSSSSQQPESSFTPCPCSKHSGGFPSPFRINPDCPRRTTREPTFLPTGPPAQPLPASPAVCEIAQPFPHGRLPATPALPPLGTLAPRPPKLPSSQTQFESTSPERTSPTALPDLPPTPCSSVASSSCVFLIVSGIRSFCYDTGAAHQNCVVGASRSGSSEDSKQRRDVVLSSELIWNQTAGGVPACAGFALVSEISRDGGTSRVPVPGSPAHSPPMLFSFACQFKLHRNKSAA